MAGAQVKKGFIFYLFMLIAVLFVAFLVTVMVMLFTPFKPILGVLYFNYEDSKVHNQTTGATEVNLDFEAIKQIVVNCDYASVSVTKSTEDKSKDCVKITNTSKGFATSGDFEEFDYSILTSTDGLGNQVLTISVKEPQGFLFFSKNVGIEICISKASATNFNATTFSITTKSGNVTIGNAPNDNSAYNLNIADLSVTTEGGDINVTTENGETDDVIGFNSLFLTTGTGNVSISKKVSVRTDSKFTILSNGKMNFENIEVPAGTQLVVNNGSFYCDTIMGNVSVSNLVDGSIQINKITGTNTSFDTNGALSIGKASIRLGSVGCVSIPFGNRANIEIDSLEKSSIIRTTSGNIKVNQKIVEGCYFQTDSGNMDLTLEDLLNDGRRDFISQTGKITLRFTGHPYHINQVKTNGDVDIYITSSSKFTLSANTYEGEPIKTLGDRLKIEFITSNLYNYPFRVNYEQFDSDFLYEDNQLLIYTNGKINVRLIK